MNHGIPPRSSHLRETPLFAALALNKGSGHAVWRMLRAQAVAHNGPTPPPTSMERVVMRERAGLMYSADEHHPDL